MTVKEAGGGASGGSEEGQGSILDYEGFSFLDDEYRQLRQRSSEREEFGDEAQHEGVYLDGK